MANVIGDMEGYHFHVHVPPPTGWPLSHPEQLVWNWSWRRVVEPSRSINIRVVEQVRRVTHIMGRSLSVGVVWNELARRVAERT